MSRQAFFSILILFTDFQPSFCVFSTVNIAKVALASALLAAAVAFPAAPAPYGAPEVYDAAPEAFAYTYGVADDYTNNNFKKEETQDEYGKYLRI